VNEFVALDHVIVGVRDLDAAALDYAKLLGRAPSWRGEHPGWGTANVLFRLENSYLELVAPSGDGPFGASLRARLEESGEGPLGFALRTEDATRCAAALRERGLGASDPIAGEGHHAVTGAVRRWKNVMLPGLATRGILVLGIEHRSPPDALPMAHPTAAVAAAISGIDHVVVRTDAPDAAIRFYGQQLGLRLALDKSFEQWGARLLFFRVGGVTVEIAAPLPAVATPAAEDSFWGISWRTPDIGATHARLAASGFEVSELRPGRRPGTEVCTVRSPTHGVATLVIGTPQAAPRLDGRTT
jgi:catechol 2,3-dioxygenase-like lactoylglutathione lyase family enzyme